MKIFDTFPNGEKLHHVPVRLGGKKLHYKTEAQLIKEGLYRPLVTEQMGVLGNMTLPTLYDRFGKFARAGRGINVDFGKPIHLGDPANPFTVTFARIFKPGHTVESQYCIDSHPEWFEYR